MPNTTHRYAPKTVAERAKGAAGFPERFAMQALGQGSKAVHRVYCRKADFVVPSLEAYELAAAREPGPLLWAFFSGFGRPYPG